MKRTFLLIVLFFFATMTFQVQAEQTSRNALFPTDKGSSVAVNVTLGHDGLVNGKLTMQVNKTYLLNISMTVEALGQDVQDIHDIAVTTTMTKTNVLQKTTYYHSGIYMDSDSRLKEGDTWSASIEIIPLGPTEKVDGVTLSVIISIKENVKNNIDPKTEFTPITYEVTLNPDEKSYPITDFKDGIKINKSVVTYMGKESQVNFTIIFGADSMDNETQKPIAKSQTKYSLYFYLKVLKLGPDATDVHDLEISILLQDESLKDKLPNSDSKYFFAMSYASDAKLQEGDEITTASMFYIASNLNGTTAKLKINVKAKEGVENFIDPTSTIADFTVEMEINPTGSKSNIAKSPISIITVPVAVLPLLRKKRKEKNKRE